jgi:hypothetical protein
MWEDGIEMDHKKKIKLVWRIRFKRLTMVTSGGLLRNPRSHKWQEICWLAERPLDSEGLWSVELVVYKPMYSYVARRESSPRSVLLGVRRNVTIQLKTKLCYVVEGTRASYQRDPGLYLEPECQNLFGLFVVFLIRFSALKQSTVLTCPSQYNTFIPVILRLPYKLYRWPSKLAQPQSFYLGDYRFEYRQRNLLSWHVFHRFP